MMGFLDLFKKKKEGVSIAAPVEGKIIPLKDVPDPVFAEGIMGEGIAIDPTVGKIFAPFDGTVTTLFPTGHAVGLTSTEGLELLIHIGMDTVKLDGKHFEKKVSDGDSVKKGDLLIEVDLKAVSEEGYPIVTPVIICDPKDYTKLIFTEEKEVHVGDEICFCEKQ